MKRDFIYTTDFNVDEIHNFFESAVDIKNKLINGEDFKPFRRNRVRSRIQENKIGNGLRSGRCWVRENFRVF